MNASSLFKPVSHMSPAILCFPQIKKSPPGFYFSRSGLSLSLSLIWAAWALRPDAAPGALWPGSGFQIPTWPQQQPPGRAFLTISDHLRANINLRISVIVFYITFFLNVCYFTNWPCNGSFPRKLPNHWVSSNFGSAPRLVTLRTSE